MRNIFLKKIHICFTKQKSEPQSPIRPPSPTKQDIAISPNFIDTGNYSESDADLQPDLAAAFASQRFFFSSPGRSNSIIESLKTTPPPPPALLDGTVAIKKYSRDPYKDFTFSMREMIKARNISDVKKDWEFLHELLICYLSLNPKNTHDIIIRVFADIVVRLLSSSLSNPRI
ncbi:hypothetical protein ES319_A09G060700v1 [Gossypium barbadense]|uniref:Transcription repressor n=3 Tax=Gossypium TaxID=3633 RepID=A0ABR0NPK2_GOSAR|nr:transcription repressor OFP12-like [Gossypium arboreum]KAB2065010.1 hypothetical protein ES319_A09G060700v1 [Gossypium barbadense]KAK5803074.1 hypothetical protein PVK06_030714 [Gossypium arboreum]TYH01649.1 hypothetical protein ES288_A09G076400v1 [Gossypium darwinii]